MTLDELEALAAKATPGPWGAERFGLIAAPIDGARRQVAAVVGDAPSYGDPRVDADSIRDANTRLIAAMRTYLPALIAIARAADDTDHDSRCGALLSQPRACDCRRAPIAAALARLEAP